jgi:hypothetical protein
MKFPNIDTIIESQMKVADFLLCTYSSVPTYLLIASATWISKALNGAGFTISTGKLSGGNQKKKKILRISINGLNLQ